MSLRLPLELTYAVRDLRGTFRSLRIVLLCLILGTGAIAAVQFISNSVLDSIARNGRTILGADMIMRNLYSPAPAELRQWLEARGAGLTETVEARVMATNAVTDDNTLVELKAVDSGYPQYGTFEFDSGSDLPAALANQGILLDPGLRERLNVKLGDMVRVGTTGFTVRGFITNEPDRAGGARFGLAPRAVIAAADLPATGLLQPGSMLYFDLRAKLPAGTSLPETVTALKAAFPDGGWRITDADNAAPRITAFIQKLMLFLTLVGLSALLIGGIGISNGTRAHFETRLKTIAIFKVLGASNGLIQRLYLWQVGLIALLGTAIGVAIGALLPYAIAPYLAGLLPVTIDPHLTLASFTAPVLFGLLTCFAFTLWPLGQAIRTRPLELFRSAIAPLAGRPTRRIQLASLVVAGGLATLAITTAQDTKFAVWFVAGALFSLAIFWGLGWMVARGAGYLRPRRPALRLALLNFVRPGNATANMLVSIGLGLTVLMTITLIEFNLRDGIRQNLPTDAPAFFFLDIQGDQKQAFETLLAQQPTARTIKLSPNLRGRIVSINDVPAAAAMKTNESRWLLENDRGFTYTAEMPAHSEIIAGQWWPADYQGEPLISVVQDVQRAFGLKIGDKITVNILGRDITAKVANVRTVNWANFTINFAITFSPGVLEGAPHSWLATVVADPAQEASIQRVMGRAFPNISMIRLSEAVNAAGDILGNIASAVRFTALVAIVTGILVLAGSLAATRNQRLYDTVVLKVIGISRRTLLAGFVFEFGLLGLLAGGVSLALGSLISWAVMTQMMALGWQFFAIPALLTGLLGFALPLVIGWLAIGRVLAAPAAPYLRNE